MRIAIGQLWQETNTFNPWPTTRQDFEQFGVLRGPALQQPMKRQSDDKGHYVFENVPVGEKYTLDVERSREELAESTQEQAPPAPSGDPHPPSAPRR